MTTEITDYKVKEPIGWIFFDAECRFCVAGRRRWGRVFERRGFAWLPLQTPDAAARLALSEDELRVEMQLLLADGQVVSGTSAWIVLLRSVWWLWPLGALLGLPGIHDLSSLGYQWIARHRHCFGGLCNIKKRDGGQHRHRAFFEMP